MIISKAGPMRALRILGVICALAMGFMTLVGTSEDDAKKAAGIDTSFDEDAEIELEPVTVEKTAAASIQQAGEDCNTMTINAALEALEDEIDGLDEVDIESVELDYVSGTYTASWTPAEVTSFTCRLTITGTESTTIAETAVNGADGSIDATLTQDQIDVINYYLANRNETFEYCVECDDEEIDSYSVTYEVDIGVVIEGEI